MEEIKIKKKLNKKPLIICLVLALVFGIVGFMDIKSNAAESQCSIEFVMPIYTVDGGSLEIKKYVVSGQDDMLVYYVQSHNQPTTDYKYSLAYVVSDYPMTVMEYSSYDYGETFSSDGPYPSVEIFVNGQKKYVRQAGTYRTGTNNFYVGMEFEWNNCKKITKWYDSQEFCDALINGTLETVNDFDYRNLVESDDLPIVQNVNFDRIDTSEFKNGENIKHIVDYLRFEPNPNYKLMIMVCPTIYSTYGSKNYVADFEKYEYSKWIYMCIADENLKEISCDIGSFKMPTDDISDIKISDYYLYYEEIFNSLGNGAFKPTMAYRLAYVDVVNGLVGPSTYIKPFSYNNVTPNTESYSYFTLYTDGTRNTEKIMNLKTWSAEYDASNGETSKDLDEFVQDMKDTVVNVGDYLKDKIVVDNDVDVQEATNWLYSVVSFIKSTPSMVGSVLSFLPQPILYGMYITIFLGCIASAIAIVKALI